MFEVVRNVTCSVTHETPVVEVSANARTKWMIPRRSTMRASAVTFVAALSESSCGCDVSADWNACLTGCLHVLKDVMLKLVLEAHGTEMLGGGWFVTPFSTQFFYSSKQCSAHVFAGPLQVEVGWR